MGERILGRVLLVSGVAIVVGGVLLLPGGCPTYAELPTPFGVDAGVGGRDQPCTSTHQCYDADNLVCTAFGDETEPKCRLLCDPDVSVDPCGTGSRCIPLEGDDDSVCVHVGVPGEPCPCDDDLRCIVVEVDGGMSPGTCRETCELPPDDAGFPDGGFDDAGQPLDGGLPIDAGSPCASGSCNPIVDDPGVGYCE